MTGPNPLPRFVLPGSWLKIDLTTDASIAVTIRSAAIGATGSADEFSALRGQIRRELSKAAGAAKGTGAREFYLARELSPGLPLPASLSVLIPELDLRELDTVGPISAAGILKAALPASQMPDEVSDLRIDTAAVTAYRRSYRDAEVATVDSEVDESATVRQLHADYWIVSAKPARIALLSFSTALLEYEEQMLELFDAIVQTAYWPDRQGTYATGATDAHSAGGL